MILVPQAESAAPWLDALVTTRWSFGVAGLAPTTRWFFFNRDGRIKGYSHFNEQGWRVQNNVLEIYGADGRLTWRFQPLQANGELTFAGAYQRDTAGRRPQMLKPLGARNPKLKVASLAQLQRQLGEARVKPLFRQAAAPFLAKACALDAALHFSEATAADQRNITERLEIHGAELWELRDVIVYTRHGITMIDDFVVEESLLHFPHHLFPMLPRTGDSICLAELDISANRTAAYHMTGGNLENYFHFFFEVISKLCTVFLRFVEKIDNLSFLLPTLKARYQFEMLEIARRIPDQAFESLTLQTEQAIGVERLFFPRPCPASSLYPNDLTTAFIADFNRVAGAGLAPLAGLPGEMIYISRRDSSNRVVENEAELEQALRALGFEIAILSNMPVILQIALFAGARLVVGPHGAGLTNLAFCRPGASVIELHMDGNLNWVYRRISQVLGLNYDYLIGEASQTEHDKAVHGRRYRIDVPALLRLVREMA